MSDITVWNTVGGIVWNFLNIWSGVEGITWSWKLTNFRTQQKPPPFFAVQTQLTFCTGRTYTMIASKYSP
jgi:hypothetical protein